MIEKSCQKCLPKASPRSLFNFGKQSKTAITYKKFFWKWNVLKENPQKALKKLTLLFFQTQFLLMDKILKKKRGLELVTSRSSGYETSSEIFFY